MNLYFIILCWPETLCNNHCEKTRHLVVAVENKQKQNKTNKQNAIIKSSSSVELPILYIYKKLIVT